MACKSLIVVLATLFVLIAPVRSQGDLPSYCASYDPSKYPGCEGVEGIGNSACNNGGSIDLDCYCTQQYFNSLVTCFNSIAACLDPSSASGVTDAERAQTINLWHMACDGRNNFEVTSPAISGFESATTSMDSSGSSPTATPTMTSSGASNPASTSTSSQAGPTSTGGAERAASMLDLLVPFVGLNVIAAVL